MSNKTNQAKADKAAERARAAREAERVDAAGTVTVACRLPCGLVVPVDGFDMDADGKVSACTGVGHLRFKGAHDKMAMVDESGHGLTSGIDAKAWAAIEHQFSKSPILLSGALFSKRKAADARAAAQERSDVNIGFTGVDPDAPGPRLEVGDKPNS